MKDKQEGQAVAQESGGDHAINVGHVTGDIHIHQVTAPAREMPCNADVVAALKRLDLVPNRIKILDWMDKTFSTRMVNQLRSDQLGLLNLYLDKVLGGKGK